MTGGRAFMARWLVRVVALLGWCAAIVMAGRWARADTERAQWAAAYGREVTVGNALAAEMERCPFALRRPEIPEYARPRWVKP